MRSGLSHLQLSLLPSITQLLARGLSALALNLAAIFLLISPSEAQVCTQSFSQIQTYINSQIVSGVTGGITAPTLNTLLTNMNNCAPNTSALGGGVLASLNTPLYATTPSSAGLLTGGAIGTSGPTIPLWSQGGVWGGPVSLVGGATTPIDLYTAPPTNGDYDAAYPIISIHPTIGWTPGDYFRGQRVTFFTSRTGPTISEFGNIVNALSNTGYSPSWTQSTAYNSGSPGYPYVQANGNIYRLITPGTSASSGTGPSGTALSGIVDGSAVWGFVCPGICNAKMGEFVGLSAGANSGNVWAGNYDLVLTSGFKQGFANTVELDFTNDSDNDCIPCNELFIGANGKNKIGQIISIVSPNTSFPAANYAIAIGGSYVASIADFSITDGHSQYAIIDQVGSSHTSLIKANAAYSASIIDTQSATGAGSSYALVTAVNQNICLAGFNVCESWNSSTAQKTLIINAQGVQKIDTSGNETLLGDLTLLGIPASAGSGGLYVCIDNAGKMYKKASCP